jgi:antimicrobial peptide system SdpB family protein
MLTTLGRKAHTWALRSVPWSNVYGLARTILALGTTVTLVFSPSVSLFRPGAGALQVPACEGARAASAFCLAAHQAGSLELGRWAAIALLLVIASGWRPRFTGVLHAWLAWSLNVSAAIVDGGDQVTSVLTLILVPVTLTDPRTWHWSAPPARKDTLLDDALRLVAITALTVARVQVAGIYFQATVGKLAVEDWTNGTALWYWLLDPQVGAPAWLAPSLRALLATPAVALLTWGVLVLEASLTLGLFLPKKRWGALLVGGIALHAGIIFVHGLISFALAMFAALILYLRPTERVFRRLARSERPRARPLWVSALTPAVAD